METKVIDNHRDDSRTEVPEQIELLKDWCLDRPFGGRKGERIALPRKEMSGADAEPLVKSGAARYVNGGPNGPVADEKSEGALVRDCPFGRAGDQLKACALGADEVRFAVRKGWARVEDKAVQEATIESAPPRAKIKRRIFPSSCTQSHSGPASTCSSISEACGRGRPASAKATSPTTNEPTGQQARKSASRRRWSARPV